jgi:hypothetical protein
MTLSDLIEIRDAMTEAKEVLRQLALSEIDKKNSLWDKLKTTIDKTYGPIAKMNLQIEMMTNIEVEITND